MTVDLVSEAAMGKKRRAAMRALHGDGSVTDLADYLASCAVRFGPMMLDPTEQVSEVDRRLIGEFWFVLEGLASAFDPDGDRPIKAELKGRRRGPRPVALSLLQAVHARRLDQAAPGQAESVAREIAVSAKVSDATVFRWLRAYRKMMERLRVSA